jgi:hypothetical protein
MAFTEKTVSWVGGLVLKTDEQKSSCWFQNIPLINWTILFVFASMLNIQPFLKAWPNRLEGGGKNSSFTLKSGGKMTPLIHHPLLLCP